MSKNSKVTEEDLNGIKEFFTKKAVCYPVIEEIPVVDLKANVVIFRDMGY